MLRKDWKLAGITVVLLVLSISGWICLFGCSEKKVSDVSSDPMVLDSVEVKGYQGKKLSILCTSREDGTKAPELIDTVSYTLSIMGMVASVQAYTYEEVLNYRHYRKFITLKSETWTERIDCEGVLVSELVGRAGPLPEARGIIFRAQDGYEMSFTLDYILKNKVIIAYKLNSNLLTPEGGYPFILISETQHGEDWVKWITEIELVGEKEE